MDCLFNLQIPKASDERWVIWPISKTFVTGTAKEYGAPYQEGHKILAKLTHHEYNRILEQLNDTMRRYWPCAFTIWAGYLLAPFSFGASFFLPYLCIGDGKKALLQNIGSLNRCKLREKGIELVYVQGFSTAWIELIHYVQPADGKPHRDSPTPNGSFTDSAMSTSRV